jgi:hypothetical protein
MKSIKVYKLLIVILCLLGFCSGAGADPNVVRRLANFGYYEADSAAHGHYMDKIVIPSDGTYLSDYTNILHFNTSSLWGQPDPRRAVIDAANLGYKVIMYSGNSLDNQENWASDLATIKSYYTGYEDYMFAIQLLDEPDGIGWTRAQVEGYIDLARSIFNDNVPLTVNVDNPRPANTVPRNMDLVMHDLYIGVGMTKLVFDDTMSSALDAIRSQAPGQPIFIIGQCFSDSTLGYPLPTLEQQGWYYETALNNSDISGWAFFILGRGGSLQGAITSPESLSLHKVWGQAIKGQTVGGTDVVDRFDGYVDQAALNAEYIGTCPTLTVGLNHGEYSGKCVQFGAGSEMATRQIFVQNQAGTVEAYLYDGTSTYDSTSTASQYFGFRVLNGQGNHIAVYAHGCTQNYLLEDDSSNAVFAFDTGCPKEMHWQKASFVFDGSGVKVYMDSLLRYQATSGWAGGFTAIGFYDPWDSNEIGFVDDIRVYSQTTTVTASSHDSNHLAINTVNDSGMTGNTHNNDPNGMWLTEGVIPAPPPHWMQFMFDQPRSLTEVQIWNYNGQGLSTLGMKQIQIQYSLTGSTDPSEWTTVYSGVLPMADGLDNHPADLTVSFTSVLTKYVLITSDTGVDVNWSSGVSSRAGLSEVRFAY